MARNRRRNCRHDWTRSGGDVGCSQVRRLRHWRFILLILIKRRHRRSCDIWSFGFGHNYPSSRRNNRGRRHWRLFHLRLATLFGAAGRQFLDGLGSNWICLDRRLLCRLFCRLFCFGAATSHFRHSPGCRAALRGATTGRLLLVRRQRGLLLCCCCFCAWGRDSANLSQLLWYQMISLEDLMGIFGPSDSVKKIKESV